MPTADYFTTDYLALFESQRGRSRGTPSPELIQRWQSEAQWNGDTAIRKELASARRAVTLMQNTGKQFTNLKPQHQLALSAASSALVELAKELEELADWARQFHAFFASEFSAAAERELEAEAQARWADDAAVQWESGLMQELGSDSGRAAFGRWMASRGTYGHLGVAAENIHPPITRLESPARNKAYEPRVTTLRARAAWTLGKARENHRGAHTWESYWGGETRVSVSCSFTDYEAWVAYQASETTRRLVGSAAGDAL